jgi:uncharacterized protein YeaO (DUF488 family)
MTQIQTKRVYEAEEEADGFRVLVDRLWPRGIKKENLHYDLWAKEITPSPVIRQWFHEDEEKNWKSFKQKYEQELEKNPATKPFLKELKNHDRVTLIVCIEKYDA